MENVCQICYCDFGKKDSKKVTCGGCSTEMCAGCIKTYIMSIPSQPECPHCKFLWDKPFCNSNLTKKFMKGEYKKNRIELSYKQEELKLKTSMKDVANMIEAESYTEKIKKKKEELRKMQEMIDIEKAHLRMMKDTQKNLKKPNYNHSEYTTKCPKNNCNGYLNHDFTCLLCDTTYCEHCMEPISHDSTGGESKTQHICNPDIVATYNMIKKDTKPCPNCSELISKINGCDQMWCIKCHATFSWESGKIVDGRIHNPHYLEWKKKNDGANIRQPGEILCGGIPDHGIVKEFLEMSDFTLSDIRHFRNYQEVHNDKPTHHPGDNPRKKCNLPIFMSAINQNRFFHWLIYLRRNIVNFRNYHLDWYREECAKNDITRDLRIKFIRKQIIEEQFKKKVYKCNQNKKKNLEILHVFELCYVVCVEQFNDIFHKILKLYQDPCNHYKNEYYKLMVSENGEEQTKALLNNYRMNMHIKYVPKIIKNINNIEQIIKQCNEHLYKIALKYETGTPIINRNLETFNITIKTSYSINENYINLQHSLQTINRTKYNDEEDEIDRDYYWKWSKDVILIKEIFYEEEFNKPIKIRKDGSWRFKKNDAVQNDAVQNDAVPNWQQDMEDLPEDVAIVNAGGIRV